MAEPLEIVLKLKDGTKAANYIDKVGAATKKAGSAAKFAAGPYQKLTKAQEAFNAAARKGTTSQMADAAFHLERAQKALQRWQQRNEPADKKVPSSVFSKMFGAVGLGRMSGFGRIAAPLLSAAGPIGIAGGAAVAAAAALYKLAEASSQALTTFQSLRIAGGGTQRETGQLRFLGGALGMSQNDMGSMVQSIQESISSSQFGMMFGGRLGIRNLPGPMGNQDWSRNALEAAKAIARIHDPQERLRTARAIGAPDLAKLGDLSPETLERIFRVGGLFGDMFSPERTRNAMEFNVALAELSAQFDKLKVAAGTPLLRGAQGFAKLIEEPWRLFSPTMTADAFLNFGKGKDDPAGQNAAMNSNSQSLDENTYAVNSLREQMKRGDRTGRAIGGGMTHEALRQALQTNAYRLSAF